MIRVGKRSYRTVNHGIELEISTGESLESASHKEIVNVLADEYDTIANVESGTCVDFDERYIHMPDVIIDFTRTKSDYGLVCLEVKTSYGDLQRGLYQCRYYKSDGLSPYLTFSKTLFRENEDKIREVYNSLPTNLPGILLIQGGSTILSIEPNYEE